MINRSHEGGGGSIYISVNREITDPYLLQNFTVKG